MSVEETVQTPAVEAEAADSGNEQPPATEAEAVGSGVENQGENQEPTNETAGELPVADLSPENKSFFSKMSEGGMKIAKQLYEGFYKASGTDRAVAKLEIAYNQFFIDRHQEKTVKLKSRMDGLDLKIGTLDKSKEEISSVMNSLAQQDMPGGESLKIKLQEIDNQKNEFLNKKESMQSKFEARSDKIKTYTSERDRIADRLINRYENNLKPLELEISNLKTYKDELALSSAVTEAKHKDQLAKLDTAEKTKVQLEETLRKGGMSDKAIKKFGAIKQLEATIAEGREKVRKEKEDSVRRQTEMDKKIANVEAKANPYRNKQNEFKRIKEKRPVEVETKAKSEIKESDNEVKEPTNDNLESTGEKTEEKERLPVATYINEWNLFLGKTHNDEAVPIDTNDFLKTTKLSNDDQIESGDFENILGCYLRYKRISTDQFKQNINKFFKQSIVRVGK